MQQSAAQQTPAPCEAYFARDQSEALSSLGENWLAIISRDTYYRDWEQS